MVVTAKQRSDALRATFLMDMIGMLDILNSLMKLVLTDETQ